MYDKRGNLLGFTLFSGTYLHPPRGGAVSVELRVIRVQEDGSGFDFPWLHHCRCTAHIFFANTQRATSTLNSVDESDAPIYVLPPRMRICEVQQMSTTDNLSATHLFSGIRHSSLDPEPGWVKRPSPPVRTGDVLPSSRQKLRPTKDWAVVELYPELWDPHGRRDR